jgi:hypothetical protein
VLDAARPVHKDFAEHLKFCAPVSRLGYPRRPNGRACARVEDQDILSTSESIDTAKLVARLFLASGVFQQVTCRIALVSSGSCFSSSIASAVGTINNLILRRLASRFTSSITGSAPVPVPITSCLHVQGIFYLIDNGVWAKASRNFLDGFFLRLWT